MRIAKRHSPSSAQASTRLATMLLPLAMALGCMAPGSVAGGGQSDTPAPQKTIIVAAGGPVVGYAPWSPSAAGGTFQLQDIPASGLVSTNEIGQREGRLASKLPSLDDGTMVILSDGRMQATWSLRPNVKWHNGMPFTADDVAFGWEAAADPKVPPPTRSGPAEVMGQIDRIEARDPLTVRVTWKRPFYHSLDLGLVNLWPLPKQLIGAAFEEDRDRFLNLPYWTTEFVHLGPFRLVDFGLGENVLFERFDEYFMGRPKVGRVLIRAFADANTLVANLRSGAVDLAAGAAISYELAMTLRDAWATSGEGTVLQQKGDGFQSLFAQMNPEYGRPVEISRDVRVRRGLYFGVDRASLSAVMVPGAEDTSVDSFMPDNDPRAAMVGKPFARYAYNPTAAIQEFASVGWRRETDGRLLNQSGEQVQMTIRSTAGADSEQQNSILAQFWRDLGFDVIQEILPRSLVSDVEVRAKFATLETSSVTGGDSTLARWDSRIAPTPERRYVGNNRGSYINPAYDRILVALQSSLDEREQGRLLREGGEILATDLPAMPLYFSVDAGVVRKGVRALVDDFGGQTRYSNFSRNAHLWDRD